MAEEKPVPNPSTPNAKGSSRRQERGEVVTVNILGNEIRLRTEVGSDYIHKLAQDIETRVRRSMSDSGVMSSLRAVILVCLELADELEKEKKQRLRIDKNWDERIDKLLGKIPSV